MTPAFTLTAEQLSELVKDAVASALAEASQDTAPLLLDRAGIARRLGIGTSTVDRLRREGMPCVFVGDSPRFMVDDCLAFLRIREPHTLSNGEKPNEPV